jgi:hypothetical protein
MNLIKIGYSILFYVHAIAYLFLPESWVYAPELAYSASIGSVNISRRLTVLAEYSNYRATWLNWWLSSFCILWSLSGDMVIDKKVKYFSEFDPPT